MKVSDSGWESQRKKTLFLILFSKNNIDNKENLEDLVRLVYCKIGGYARRNNKKWKCGG
jgi:hypothetical protein